MAEDYTMTGSGLNIPAGSQYDTLRHTIARIAETFPSELGEITQARIDGWVKEIDSGTGRDADGIRDDIFRVVIGSSLIQSTLGVDKATADKLILGGNDGGVNFSDLNVSPTAAAENRARKGEGGAGPDPETKLTIMTSKERKYFFDNASGNWYISYGLPGSNRTLLFEASPDQMDAIYGQGKRPTNYQTVNGIDNVLGKSGVTFGGNITQMAGTGTFENHFKQQLTFAMDDGKLPSWMEGNAKAMDILYIAQVENKNDDWVVNQLSTLPEFKARFPGVTAYAEQYNMSLPQAIDNFLSFESTVKSFERRKPNGNPDSVTPAMVNAFINKGYTVDDVARAYKVERRLENNTEALTAFNQVLVANGQNPLSGVDLIKFVTGEAPDEIYEIYEAASFTEAANANDLGQYFTAEDALDAAAFTEGERTLDSVRQGAVAAAQTILRFRHELDIGAYGLEHEDLVDLSLGLDPRSGVGIAEITDSLERAASSANATRNQFQARPFTTFTGDGRMQGRGVSSGRAEY